jgi:signal transduction histidine kinase
MMVDRAAAPRPPAGPLLASLLLLGAASFGFAYAISGVAIAVIPVLAFYGVASLGLLVAMMVLRARPLHVRGRLGAHWLRLAPVLAALAVAPPTDRISLGAAALAAGVVTAAWFRRAMTRAGARWAATAAGRSSRELDSSTLGGAVTSLVVTAGGASVITALAVWTVTTSSQDGRVHLDDPELALMAVMIALAALMAIGAGVSLSRSPGRDLVSISRRLDALGTQAEATMASHFAITSFDDVGGLFSDLETLRIRLTDQVSLYQDALERTRAADDEKQRFLAAVSHELRTPLNVIEGYAQLLLEGHPAPLTTDQADDVRLIRAGGNQLLALINDILDIAMIESGELRLRFASETLVDVLQEIVDVQQPLVHERPVEVIAEIGELPPVICDRRRIWQVVTNLVSNAVKFTQQGSVVVRALSIPENNAVVVQVVDSGVGIAADEVEAVFEEFRQVGDLKSRSKGTGLGLAIARSIAEAHGGTLTAESVLGQGSTFTLALPVEPPDLPHLVDIVEARARAEQTRRRRDEAGVPAPSPTIGAPT